MPAKIVFCRYNRFATDSRFLKGDCEMRRKQLCCLLLALALIAAFFTGCAGNTTQAPADNAGQTAPADIPDDTQD